MTRLTAIGFLCLAACAGPTVFNPTTGPDGGGDDGDDPVAFNEAGSPAPPDATPPPPPPPPVVYAHGPNDLYKLDTVTKKLTSLGPFQGATYVIDLALDENGAAYVTTSGGLYKLDLKTAACTQVSSGSYPNSLSFVPKGTLDPAREALVGYQGNQYVRIDTQTGAVTTVGTLSGGYYSSGDIVSVKGGGTFLTVIGGSCLTGDCLLQVNPKTGDLVQNYGSTNHWGVYGLAFWAGALYGFSNAQLFKITANGSSITTTDIPISNAPAGLTFWGAGSTTSAPVLDEDGGTIPIIK